MRPSGPPEIRGYEIFERLGKGASSEVFRARHRAFDRFVALKILRARPGETEEFRRRFRREARILSQLRHPHILRLHDFGDCGDHEVYQAMELAEGRTFREAREDGIQWPKALEILTPIAEALAYAHEMGVVHRDVKPDNILITVEGRSILADFGLALKVGTEITRLTRTGVFVGTPLYASPEVIMGESACPASDVYSLGVMLWVCLTGDPPHGKVRGMEDLKKRLDKDPEPLRIPGVPEEICWLANQTVRTDPAKRIPSDRLAHLLTHPAALTKAYSKFLDASGTVARVAESQEIVRKTLAGASPAKRLPWLLGLFGGLTLALGIGFLFGKGFARDRSYQVLPRPLGPVVEVYGEDLEQVLASEEKVGFTKRSRGSRGSALVSEPFPVPRSCPRMVRLQLLGSKGEETLEVSLCEDLNELFLAPRRTPPQFRFLAGKFVPVPRREPDDSKTAWLRKNPHWEIPTQASYPSRVSLPSEGLLLPPVQFLEAETHLHLALDLAPGVCPKRLGLELGDLDLGSIADCEARQHREEVSGGLVHLSIPRRVLRPGLELRLRDLRPQDPPALRAYWIGAWGAEAELGSDSIWIEALYLHHLVHELDGLLIERWEDFYSGPVFIDDLLARGTQFKRFMTFGSSRLKSKEPFVTRIDEIRKQLRNAFDRIAEVPRREGRARIRRLFALRAVLASYESLIGLSKLGGWVQVRNEEGQDDLQELWRRGYSAVGRDLDPTDTTSFGSQPFPEAKDDPALRFWLEHLLRRLAFQSENSFLSKPYPPLEKIRAMAKALLQDPPDWEPYPQALGGEFLDLMIAFQGCFDDERRNVDPPRYEAELEAMAAIYRGIDAERKPAWGDPLVEALLREKKTP